MTCPEITLVLPYYNEAEFIGLTLASLEAQTSRNFALVLIDNASTDGSGELCRTLTSRWRDIEVIHCHEAAPGKTQALQTGLAQVRNELMATVDADTIYPPDYVSRILELFRRHPNAAMVMAADIYAPADTIAARARRWGIYLLSRLFSAKCHTGAYAQAFRTRAFTEAGGFDPRIWGYILEDHEIVHRVGKHGRQIYSPDHYCWPSDRRGNHGAVSWTGWESLLYVLTPNRLMDWFFYRFLVDRFRSRGLDMGVLRQRDWTDQDKSSP